MAVARPAIMPHVSSSGGGDDLGSEDEVKVFKDEGEDEKRSSENLTEEKSSLIDLTESEVRRLKKKNMYICIDIINESFISATLFINRTKRVHVFFLISPRLIVVCNVTRLWFDPPTRS